MQRLTGKEIAEQTKTSITALLKEAAAHHANCESARQSVKNSQQVALWHGWNTGNRLNQIKEQIAAGDWLDWLEANFCKPVDCSIRTAQLYMKIDNDNASLRRNLETEGELISSRTRGASRTPETQHVALARPDPELLTQLKFDTVRKYSIGFVPEKAVVTHANNKKFPRLASVLNIANEWSRLKQRHIDKLQQIDFDEMREELRDLYDTLKRAYEDPGSDPITLSLRHH